MTNEEAIILLKECKEAHRSFKEGWEALDLAISALEWKDKMENYCCFDGQEEKNDKR